jgi:hypothetical protein
VTAIRIGRGPLRLLVALLITAALLAVLGQLTAQYSLWNENQGCFPVAADPAVGVQVGEQAPVQTDVWIPVGVSCEWELPTGSVVAHRVFPVPNTLFALALASLAAATVVGLLSGRRPTTQRTVETAPRRGEPGGAR